MPGEFPALSLHFARQHRKSTQQQKKRKRVEPRRSDIATCDFRLDKKASGQPRFKENRCCKSRQCVNKYSPRAILVLRHSLCDRPRNSVDRRAFISERMMPRAPGDSRGSGKFYCDSPSFCNLTAVHELQEAIPLRPMDKIEVCAAFFHWAYAISNDSSRNSLAKRLETRKRMKIRDAPKQVYNSTKQPHLIISHHIVEYFRTSHMSQR